MEFTHLKAIICILLFNGFVVKSKLNPDSYNDITAEVIESEYLKGFSLFQRLDSKWIWGQNDFEIGILNEWRNSQGIIIGIDICEFESKEIAELAVRLRSEKSFIPIFDLNDNSSINNILNDWNRLPKRLAPNKNNICAMTSKDSIAIISYQYNPNIIDREFFSNIIKQFN